MLRRVEGAHDGFDYQMFSVMQRSIQSNMEWIMGVLIHVSNYHSLDLGLGRGL